MGPPEDTRPSHPLPAFTRAPFWSLLSWMSVTPSFREKPKDINHMTGAGRGRWCTERAQDSEIATNTKAQGEIQRGAELPWQQGAASTLSVLQGEWPHCTSRLCPETAPGGPPPRTESFLGEITLPSPWPQRLQDPQSFLSPTLLYSSPPP